ncbi:MAG: molybdopterin cofactor-binding domain-containing protein [Terriglobales bacterium]
MSHRDLQAELQQHEVVSLHWFELDRRSFLQVLGGGVLVCAASSALSQEAGSMRGGNELPQNVDSWLHIAQDGRVTVYTGKVEVGQNIRTSLAQQVAEELRVPIASIAMVMGDTDLTPWDMGTFGSRTTPTMGPQLRTMASTARGMLLQLAAEHWKTKPEALEAENGKITNPATRQSVTYGELTRGQNLTKVVAADPALTAPAQWKVIDMPVPKVDGRDFVTGKHLYPSDMKRPGMLHGKVLRPGGFNAKLVSFDEAAARQMAGVQVIRDGDFIGVVAPDASTAERALAALKAQWDVPAQPSNENLFEYLKANADKDRGGDTRPLQDHAQRTGSVEEGLAAAELKVTQTYTVQYIAHAPLEPRAAVAEWNGGKLTVWTGTQRPFGVRDELMEAFRLPSEKVRVIQPDMGAGYGGKHTGDAAVEAARLSKAAGKPVKLTWTREEEFTWAYFRPAGVWEVRAGLKRDGTITAWEFHNYNSGPAAIVTPYNIANQFVQFHPVKSPLRQGSYRGLAATANHFVRESSMDELAHAASMDPLQFRQKNLTNERLRAVFEAAAQKFGWGKQKSTAERGFGMAGGTEKGSYVATCAEVEIDRSGEVHIRRVVEAFECGAVINPNGLRNQIEGCIVQASGGALFEAVQFANGKILNPRFRDYRLPRFSDLPQIEVVILDRKDLASAGAGETPIVGLAPAVGNAIFAATGTRLRTLPLAPQGLRRS